MANVLVPVDVTEAQLLVNNVPEDDGPEWSAGATFNVGDRVIKSALHKVYESAVAGNTGTDPEGADPATWMEVGATNGFRAFDRRLSAPSTKAGTIEFTIEAQTLIRAVALVGASAVSATVRVKNPAGDVLSEQIQILADGSHLIDAIAMVTIQPKTRDVAIFENIICQPGNRIEIIIGDGTGTAEVSEVLVGDVIQIGTAIFGAEVGIEDFSEDITDQFGNVDIVERAYRDVTEFPIAVNTADVGYLRRSLAQLRAKRALYYFTATGNDYGTTVYGRYEGLSTVISGPNKSDMSLKIIGATYDP